MDNQNVYVDKIYYEILLTVSLSLIEEFSTEQIARKFIENLFIWIAFETSHFCIVCLHQDVYFDVYKIIFVSFLQSLQSKLTIDQAYICLHTIRFYDNGCAVLLASKKGIVLFSRDCSSNILACMNDGILIDTINGVFFCEQFFFFLSYSQNYLFVHGAESVPECTTMKYSRSYCCSDT